MAFNLRGLFKAKPPSTVTVSGQNLVFEVPSGKTILEAALEQGIGFPHDCKVGTCGTCHFKLIKGQISELNSSAMSLTAEQFQGGYRLACQAIPKSDLEIGMEVPLDAVEAVIETRGLIKTQKNLTHDVIALIVETDRPINFLPGQYADLTVPALGAPRSYSFASPAVGTALEFYVRVVPGGQFTSWLAEASRVGTETLVRGPFGQFRLHRNKAPMICVAGGTGLAPIKCILESMLPEETTRQVALFFGARNERDLYCLEDVKNLKSKWRGRFDFIPVLSAEAPHAPWQGRRGLITEHLAEIGSGTGWEAYLCGPPAMVDAAELVLKGLGVSDDAIYADRFFDRRQLVS
jgi:NAD(P)H-flavin reductase/ferredoxin